MLQFTYSWIGVLTLVVTVVLPIITGLITTRVTGSGVKAVVLALLSAITGFGSELLNALVTATPYDVFTGLLTAFTAFLIAVAMHFGLWKPTGVSAKAQGDKGLL